MALMAYADDRGENLPIIISLPSPQSGTTGDISSRLFSCPYAHSFDSSERIVRYGLLAMQNSTIVPRKQRCVDRVAPSKDFASDYDDPNAPRVLHLFILAVNGGNVQRRVPVVYSLPHMSILDHTPTKRTVSVITAGYKRFPLIIAIRWSSLICWTLIRSLIVWKRSTKQLSLYLKRIQHRFEISSNSVWAVENVEIDDFVFVGIKSFIVSSDHSTVSINFHPVILQQKKLPRSTNTVP